MPEGVRGFQPGRQKTGGRPTKEQAKEKAAARIARKPSKFVDQLNLSGFDYVKELAAVLKEIRDLHSSTPDPVRAAELKFYYAELKALLPFMAPKLREKEIDTTEPADEEKATQDAAVSNEELLKAFDESEKTTNPRSSRAPVLATRDTSVQTETRSEENLSSVAGESDPDE